MMDFVTKFRHAQQHGWHIFPKGVVESEHEKTKDCWCRPVRMDENEEPTIRMTQHVYKHCTLQEMVKKGGFRLRKSRL